MSSDDQFPIKTWAIQVKTELQKVLRKKITPEILFEGLVVRDTKPVRDYYFGHYIPTDPSVKFDLDMRLETLRYVSYNLVVN
jgi:hypothetical protein